MSEIGLPNTVSRVALFLFCVMFSLNAKVGISQELTEDQILSASLIYPNIFNHRLHNDRQDDLLETLQRRAEERFTIFVAAKDGNEPNNEIWQLLTQSFYASNFNQYTAGFNFVSINLTSNGHELEDGTIYDSNGEFLWMETVKEIASMTADEYDISCFFVQAWSGGAPAESWCVTKRNVSSIIEEIQGLNYRDAAQRMRAPNVNNLSIAVTDYFFEKRDEMRLAIKELRETGLATNFWENNENRLLHRLVRVRASVDNVSVDENSTEQAIELLTLVRNDFREARYTHYLRSLDIHTNRSFFVYQYALIDMFGGFDQEGGAPDPRVVSLQNTDDIDDLFQNRVDLIDNEREMQAMVLENLGKAEYLDGEAHFLQKVSDWLEGRSTPFNESGDELWEAFRHDLENRQVHLYGRFIQGLLQ